MVTAAAWKARDTRKGVGFDSSSLRHNLFEALT